MGPGATLPFDILVSIIDSLASGDDADIQCLQILSQTCKFMAPLCRKHLFSSIHLQDHSKLDSRRFNELLSNNPDIAHYVRSLQYVFYNPIGDHELNILDMLRERSSLQSIAVRAPFVKWKDLPESIRSSVVFLMQLPTITELRLQSFQGFPPTALSRCGNLIDLHLTASDSLILGPPDVNPAISRSKIPTPVSLFAFLESGSYDGLAALLNSASLDDGPIVDFSGLRKASFHNVESPDDFGHIKEFIKVTTQLEHFSIYMSSSWSGALTGLGASVAITAYRTLKFLSLTIEVAGADYDPLCGFDGELGLIAGNNILGELELDVVVCDMDNPCRTDSEDWAAFDSVLTEAGSFPALHRVAVDIWWYYCRMGVDVGEVGDKDRIFQSLNEDKFPRLVESTEVEFEFSASFHDGSW